MYITSNSDIKFKIKKIIKKFTENVNDDIINKQNTKSKNININIKIKICGHNQYELILNKCFLCSNLNPLLLDTNNTEKYY